MKSRLTVFVRAYLIEIGVSLMCGYYMGRYIERTAITEEYAAKGEEPPAPAKKKRSISYQDGKLIFDLKK